jgi:uncharacterized protein YdgA (DUF945 family)
MTKSRGWKIFSGKPFLKIDPLSIGENGDEFTFTAMLSSNNIQQNDISNGKIMDKLSATVNVSVLGDLFEYILLKLSNITAPNLQGASSKEKATYIHGQAQWLINKGYVVKKDSDYISSIEMSGKKLTINGHDQSGLTKLINIKPIN